MTRGHNHRGVQALLLSACCSLPLFAACSSEQSAPKTAVAPKAAAAKPVAKPESIYDAAGKLKPSTQRVAWLEIPMGFAPMPDARPRHHTYKAEGVPLAKIRDYFSARLFTGQIDELKNGGFIYHEVVPLSAPLAKDRLDVLVFAQPELKTARLTIQELGYMGVKPLSLEQARAQIAREQKRAE